MPDIPDLPYEPPPNRPNNPQGKNLRAETAKWIERNPEVYELFQKFALQMLACNETFSAKLLAERVRWEVKLMRNGEEEYKVNNNYVAYVARKLIEDIPALLRMLRFRKVRY